MAVTKFTGATNTIQNLSDRPNQNEGLTAAQLKLKFDQAAIDNEAYLNDVLTVEIDTLNAENMKKTGDQTIQGVKTFESSPVVPTPIADMQAAPKKFVDDKDSSRKTYIDNLDAQNVKLTGNQTVNGIKTFQEAKGNWTGLLNGEEIPSSEPGLRIRVENVEEQLVNMMYNVKNYGAKGDGTTDDWQAITNAMSAAANIYGGTVFFPPGNYAVGQTLVIPPTIAIVGHNRLAVNIKGLPSLTGNLFQGIASNQGRLHMSNLSLQGHSSMQDAIYLNHSKGNTILENLLFTTFVNGVHLYGDTSIYTDGSWGVEVNNCYFYGMTGYGVNMKYGSNGNVVRKNQFWSSFGGVLVQHGYACVVKDNILQELSGFGVSVESADMTTIETNYFENNVVDVLITKEASQPAEGYSLKTVIENNLFVGGTNSTSCIKIDYAKHTSIKDCWSKNHVTFTEITANGTQTKLENNYNLGETFISDLGSGTVIKKMNGSAEEITGNMLFNGSIEIASSTGLFKLGQYFPGSPTSGQLAHDSSAKVMSFFDGTAYRKVGLPSGVKAITSPNTSIDITGTGSPDKFTVQPNNGYGIILTTNQNVICWASNFLTTGFTINIAANGAGTITYPVNVTWQVVRP